MGFLDFLGKSASDGLTIEETLMALSKGAVLIDVRTKHEYEAGHAPGSRPVDINALVASPLDAIFGDDPLADRDAAIVVICDNGFRSKLAAKGLREQGLFAEAVNGGLQAWVRDGNPAIPGPYRPR